MTLFFNPINESWIYKLYKQKTMKQKTAMQELIEILKKSKKLLEDSIQKNGGLDNEKNKNTHYYLLGIGECIIEANQLLKNEKEQIIEAYSKGYREGIRNEDAFFDKPEDYQYYKTINNQNK
jgi:hypothetical protein